MGVGIGRDEDARFRCAVSEENLVLIESAIQHPYRLPGGNP